MLNNYCAFLHEYNEKMKFFVALKNIANVHCDGIFKDNHINVALLFQTVPIIRFKEQNIVYL